MDHQPHILIVDDSAIVRKALTRQLEQFGARVSQRKTESRGSKRPFRTASTLS